jgi:hypothetical protein
LLNWYDEPCSTLAACVAGLHTAGVDHITAVDGAYELYPDGKPSSPPDQAATIHMAGQALGIATTIHTPNTRWPGNEVEKRTRMFALALAASDPGDWWISMDADMVVTQAPHNLKAQLEDTDVDAARVTLTELRDLDATHAQAQQFQWPRQSQHPIRLLFRAQAMHCRVNHHTYVTPDGRVLWNSDSGDQEPCVDILDLHVEHRENQRTLDRQEAKRVLYHRRDTLGAERGPCTWEDCTRPATRTVARNLRLTTVDPGYSGDLVPVCEKHANRIEHENRYRLEEWGIDIDKVTA